MPLTVPNEQSMLRILGTLSWLQILPVDLVIGDAQ
jgi:hypothetical protein